jgi:hypothetical protein
VAAENRQPALRSWWGLQSDAVSSQLVAAALRLNLRVMPSRVVVAALRNRVAFTENGAQHPGQVGAFKLVAWEHVWLNKTLREVAVVDGNHQAREHVEIDLGVAAGPSQAAEILGSSMATPDRLPRSMPAQPVVMSLNPIEVPHKRQELRGGDNYHASRTRQLIQLMSQLCNRNSVHSTLWISLREDMCVTEEATATRYDVPERLTTDAGATWALQQARQLAT